MQSARLGQRRILVNTQGPIRLRHACYAVSYAYAINSYAQALRAPAGMGWAYTHAFGRKMSLIS